jgi:P4 family phage/plasmid primase-like protien
MTIEKPPALPVLFDAIPNQLKKTPRWVLWRYVLIGEAPKQKWSKLPVQPNGKSASTTTPATWSDFFTVVEAYERGSFDGVGFVFDGTDNLVGIDLDDGHSPELGFTNKEHQHIADSVQGYMEVSPSGTGVKIFTYADLQAGHVDHAKGLEIYKDARYFTVTGHKLGGEIPSTFQDLSAHIPERTIRQSGDAFADYSAPLEGWDIARVETDLLSKLDSNGYDDWLQVGQILHHQFEGDFEALELWDRWSQSGDEYQPNACDKKWLGFGKKGGLTLRSLIYKAGQKTLQDALDAGMVVLDANNPITNAKRFLEAQYSCEEGVTLAHYAQDWYIYLQTHYDLIEEQTIRSELYKFLDKCVKQVKGNMAPFNPNPANVSAILDSIKALVHLENKPNTRPPVWLSGYAYNKPDASKLISLENGIFHFEQNILIPHSLGFFTTNSLPFAYDPAAQCPNWLKFLDDIWPNDEESKQLLQEYMAYVLSGDTKQQKMLNLVGPRRSGKGTINKILVALLGQHNTVAPQMDELVDSFGLQPWLNKLLASFTDARLTGRNTAGIVSQLLRIVGGDTITVNRKNKEAWNGYLPTRIIIYSNEALQLSESSNALTGRMLVLSMTNSFFGKEDVTLSDKLIAELSGIFNWCLEGHKRRLSRPSERFVQPKSGIELLETMEELGNPMSSFISDVLVYDVEGHVTKDALFACYKRWSAHKNIPVGTDMAFKRKFLAATQDKHISSTQLREGNERVRVYIGVKFTEKAQKFVDSLDSFTEDIF